MKHSTTPNRLHRTPSYRRQRRKNCHDLAFVEIDGKRHYLGNYDTRESRERYHRLIAEWEASGGCPYRKLSPTAIARTYDKCHSLSNRL